MKRDKLEKDITRARKDLVQAEADQEVARLRQDHVEEPFKLQAPNRKDIARWVASCWGDLTPATITSGFRRVGILNDTRCCEDEMDSDKIENSIVEDLESCRLAGETVDSDDDIFDSELTSDSEDEGI
ncbi:DNA binding [Phytophthora oleae]|uniref:DNA binding n=1 Tax=Phytophthora oleae TaxID=2107226 RepID=A0ABD3EW36_9STRA